MLVPTPGRFSEIVEALNYDERTAGHGVGVGVSDRRVASFFG